MLERVSVYRIAMVLFAFALAIRVTVVVISGPSTVRFGDGKAYLDTAAALCSSGTYPATGNLPFFRAPGLPFFIAAVTACSPSRIAAVKLGLAITDAVSAVLIFWLAALLTHRRRAAIIAGALAASWPFFIVAVTDIRSEPLFMAFMTASICAVLEFRERGGGRAILIGGGVSAALAALTRPSGLVMGAVLAILLVTFSIRRRSHRPLAAGGLFAAAFVLALLPWVGRNYVRFGELIVVNDAVGYNFWRGSSPEMMVLERASSPEEFARGSVKFETIVTPGVREWVDRQTPSPARRSREWSALAVRSIRRDPGGYVRFTVRKAIAYWRPWVDWREHGLEAVIVTGIVNSLLFVLAAWGLVAMWRRDRDLGLSALTLLVAGWILHVPFQVVMRFRIPMTDPLLLAMAASAMDGFSVRRDDGSGKCDGKRTLVE
ncbi:MAG: glycosyltransferase family 39 protein [Acidobacteriota bacterium]